MKQTFYFAHDYNASQDPKILNMMSELGIEGYGLFWLLIEKLAEANGKLSLNDLKGLAFAWNIDSTILKSLVNDFQLFVVGDECFSSKRLNEHLKSRQKSAEIRSKAGRTGGLASAKQRLIKRQANVDDFQAKERKVKESKVNTNMQPEGCGKEISEIINLFKEINPSYKKLFNNKTQRDAVSRMIKEHIYENLIAITKYAIQVQGEKYSPVITTPLLLENKMGDLKIYRDKELKNKKTYAVFN